MWNFGDASIFFPRSYACFALRGRVKVCQSILTIISRLIAQAFTIFYISTIRNFAILLTWTILHLRISYHQYAQQFK
jgi:hypothetical protein